MAHAAFDTLKYAEQLRLAGITEQQAKIMSEAQNEILLELVGTQVASKQDINELKTEFKSDIHELRTELKSDIHELRAELKSDIMALEAKVEKYHAELNGKLTLLYWMVGFLLASNMAIIVKLFIH